jgi:hypothetical protein
MAMQKEQNYANHKRIDPMFHQVIFFIALASVVLTLWNVIRNFGLPSVAILLLAVGLLLVALRLRVYATKLQDRIVRLEERLRLQTLLTGPSRSRIMELTESQLIALRFASDAEVPALVDRALSEKLSNDAIKKAIVVWRPDDFRV